MKERFITKDFDSDSMETIKWVAAALDSYAKLGYTASVRQLHYYGVSRNLVPNTVASYKRLTSIVTDARMAGYLDWAIVVDRNRSTSKEWYFKSPEACMQSAVNNFKLDKWGDQPNYVEVVVEKAALEGVLEPVCRKLEVPFTSLRGYGSATIMYDIGKRLQERYVAGGKQIHIIALADHDPSGQDITRDLDDRLNLFANSPVNVHRIALNMDQIDEFRLPENPAKTTDPRSGEYIRRFGNSSWELDAIPIEVLALRVQTAVLMFRDERIWESSLEREDTIKEQM